MKSEFWPKSPPPKPAIALANAAAESERGLRGIEARRRGAPAPPSAGADASRPASAASTLSAAWRTLRRSAVATSGPIAHQKNGTEKSVVGVDGEQRAASPSAAIATTSS